MYTPKNPFVYIQGTSLYAYVYLRALLGVGMRWTGEHTYIYIKALAVIHGVFINVHQVFPRVYHTKRALQTLEKA